MERGYLFSPMSCLEGKGYDLVYLELQKFQGPKKEKLLRWVSS